ncbi:hypothetical protein IMG5_129810 [Ichthyophthirius multifiliis]|uniref:Uncharacterized protein n=1 Tax=Ichthyophthirius multifiliis TaxID=5932 RepID=G0QW73_ICHMU|nr:hypothetical protein IMG5_129810 [Ichthyophthirius multifiliis]EGR30528.1 hypothetical protein IMG5_129810 [Ichthyophthirius multifiliis]|eukprot:XP_004032115.1 hypothetical protein IMG5_129810 [Ichthyophthirius multifiliis]
MKSPDLKNIKKNRQIGFKVSYENQLLKEKMLNIDQRQLNNKASESVKQFCIRHANSKIYTRLSNLKNINKENKIIMKRLYNTPSVYSVFQFEQDNLKRLNYSQNISQNARRKNPLDNPTPLYYLTKIQKKQNKENSEQNVQIKYDYQTLDNSIALLNYNLQQKSLQLNKKNNQKTH